MAGYKRILVGLDLSEESSQILEKAGEISRAFAAEVSLAHVIEPLTFAYGGDIPMDLSEVQEQLQTQAREQLSKAAQRLDVPTERQHVILGQPATEIHRLADELEADLIIIGSHGRHGLALLLGSTANGVLHGAGCDVLAVRVQSE
ncbi:universal stress protein [Microbulbifer thermotolerans]|uniref:Universal stress protein n=1 Tax=Microbulbifer thermotolerans TaxID=252514 RepID=A0A143HLT1_MICTH|nr:universal stress protein [Microbulbifer thermotolerans]AMX02648.1 universal stress protein UspA [Microbulbifer thermotolerans]MCX2779801.1 universal stress protein [Microbulbifer thermotolerans]MCX2782267.1 universal stress protein [Microbulbifer thermotolerans]MCX2794469.1 universal stress protein [Microbulbifer thermotolerans]MCX2800420.1 universal stress protein [Microbulbifer thermotolerans]